MSRALMNTLLLVVVAIAGCGRPPAPMASVPGATPRVAGDDAPKRKRGYDRDRWRRIAPDTQPPQTMPRQGPLPARVDLRAQCPPIYDQGELGACTAFAIACGLREQVQIKRGGKPVHHSALFFYYQERVLAGTVARDAGATIADGMKVLTRTGSAPEVYWPYEPAGFALKPPAQAYAEAPKWKLRKAYHLASLEDVKTALSRGHAVAMGFATYKGFDDIGKDGKMRMPARGERPDGGHACLAVGYDDTREVVIVRNSYGRDWGDGGYFYMPYAFAADKKQVDEWWTAD